jgi:hypothetical protein
MKEQESAWLLSNEFARVRLSLDHKGNAPRLRIEDLDSGTSICLDSLLLAGLVWATDEILAIHVDPETPQPAARSITSGPR